jgi:outer membrane protein TolC
MRNLMPSLWAAVRRSHRGAHRAVSRLGSRLAPALLLLCIQPARSLLAQSAAPAAPAVAAPSATQPTPSATTAPAPKPSVSTPAAPAKNPVDSGGESFDFSAELNQGSESLSADQVAALAVKTAPSLVKANATSEQAREAASQAVVAVYPRLDLIAQYTRLSPPPTISLPFALPGLDANGQPMIDPMTMQPVLRPFAFPKALVNQYLLQAKVSYPVSDLFFQILPRYRAAQETARARELSARAESFSIALQAREAFYNYARARAALLVARSALAQREAQLRDTESLVKAGTLARVEQMRADADVAATRVAVARALGSVAVARTALRTLLHREGEQDIAVSEDFSQPLPALGEDKEQLLQEALRNRSELKSLETMAGVADRNERAANADKLPKLSVAGQTEVANPNQRANAFVSKWTPTWEVLGLLTWSPNDFASGDARASQAAAQRAQALADIAALEDAVRLEVSRAYEDYQAAREAMSSALTEIGASEESYRVRREQFRAGAAVATDVIIAEGDLNRARLDLINASIDLRIARARLTRAVERG